MALRAVLRKHQQRSLGGGGLHCEERLALGIVREHHLCRSTRRRYTQFERILFMWSTSVHTSCMGLATYALSNTCYVANYKCNISAMWYGTEQNTMGKRYRKSTEAVQWPYYGLHLLLTSTVHVPYKTISTSFLYIHVHVHACTFTLASFPGPLPE